jgi:Ser/Thr protein kinase RdoA (MazF antagonist)
MSTFLFYRWWVMADEKQRKNSFYRLEPELVLQATEEGGYRPTGELTQLNSYENRVFDLRLEKGDDRDRVIVKFYRPGRWSRESLLEEHSFLHELRAEGFSVAAPLILNSGSTLGEKNDLYYTLFPKIQGRLPEELLPPDLKRVGRLLAQVHNIGARKKFKHRPVVGESPFSPWETLELLSERVSPELWPRYESAAILLLERIEDELDVREFQRIHGDCHRGNLVSFGEEMTLLDFDDCGTGPIIQDFWMLFTSALGDDERESMIQGYEELRQFPHHQWDWIPLLRGLRILSYSGWIARRWEDPFFPKTFPDFGSYTMWAEETEALEKLAWSLPQAD